MRNSTDPTIHRNYQQALVSQAQKLLEDDTLRVQTTAGEKLVVSLVREVTPADNAVAVKQRMIALNLFDRDLQRRMPTGQTLDVTLSQKTMFGGQTPVARLRVMTVSPTDELLTGSEPKPLDAEGLRKILASQPPSLGRLPQTLVVASTSGLTDDARRLAGTQGGRSLILAEVNNSGGWTITAPPEVRDLASKLDPETPAEKTTRILEEIDKSADLYTGGASAELLAEKLSIPKSMVERVLTDYAERTPGLAARRVEGTLLLYREGLSSFGDETGDNMPFWEKVAGIFGRKESREKKVSRLAQEKAMLAHQRDKAYAEIEQVEKKEMELTASFPNAAPLAQKRIATEIAQIRKRGERIQQLVATIDKKINIIETGVHNLEMESHLSKEKLESLETVAQASEQVDVGMATLDQLNEAADAVSVAGTEMTSGAQDVLAELQAKFAAKEEAAPAQKSSTGPERAPAARATNAPPPIPAERRRVPGAAEPG